MRQLEIPPGPGPIERLMARVAPVVSEACRIRREQGLAELEEAERREAEEAAARPPPLFIPGDLVRFTAKALKSMYGSPDLIYERRQPWQPCGRCGTCIDCKPRMSSAPPAPDERFTVAACSCEECAQGRLVAVGAAGRHIAMVALEHAQLAPFGPVRKEDADAVLAQVGMRVDDQGRYFLRPPWEL